MWNSYKVCWEVQTAGQQTGRCIYICIIARRPCKPGISLAFWSLANGHLNVGLLYFCLYFGMITSEWQQLWEKIMLHWCDLHSVLIRRTLRCTHTGTPQKTAQNRALSDPLINMSLWDTLHHTLRFLWLKGAVSKVAHWQLSNQVNLVKINLVLHPFLRQSMQHCGFKANIFCHRHLSPYCSWAKNRMWTLKTCLS